MGVNPKIGGLKTPKMDGENHGGKPYEQMDDLGWKTPYFWKHPYINVIQCHYRHHHHFIVLVLQN